MAASVAVFLAAPWLDERLVWCEWVGVAAGLMLVKRLRGLRNEAWALAAATGALATAFHWAPGTLATAMQDGYASGLAVAAPIMLWDAMRAVLPFFFACRLGASPLAAWLPAAITATFLDAFWPAVFPWKYGYAQIGWPGIVQSADLFGPEFTTFMLFAHAGALVWVLAATGVVRVAGPPAVGRLAAVLCLLNWAYGAMALASWEARIAAAPAIVATLVQSDPGAATGVDDLRRLTVERLAAPAPPDLVCWPECSAGEFDARLRSFADPAEVARLSCPDTCGGLVAGPVGVPLLCGGLVYEGFAERPTALHQTALLVDAVGTIRGSYRKRHLMPFGEYVPLADIWPDLRGRFPRAATFTRGTEASVLAGAGGLRVGALLCYEDMVPEAARSLVRGGANLLVSLVNGTDFTATLTLRQHRLLAQLRAVECRRTLLRCAATGETCVVSPTGRIAAALQLHDRGTLDARVPLIDTVTLASRLGSAFPAACGLAAAAAMILGLSRRGWPLVHIGHR